MNIADNHWQKLATAAKHAAPDAPVAAPFGFSTRVVARWLAGEKPEPSVWELVSLRSLGVAAAIMFVCVGVNFNVVRDQFVSDPAAPAELAVLLTESP